MRRTLFALTVLLLAAPAQAGNWPHWRGPEANGVSPETGLPATWSQSANLRWKLPLPDLSGSTPIVWEDRLFLSVADGKDIQLWSIAREDGTVLWRRQVDDRNERTRKGNLTSPSPVTDGQRVWVLTGTGIVKAFDFEGKELWARDLQKDYGQFGILHGYASSPLLHGDTLYIQVLHGFATDDPSYLLAVDKATGQTRFRVERPTDAPKEAPDAYTTPALLPRGDRVEIVVSGADYVTGHDPETGKELWRIPGLNPEKIAWYRVVASPVVMGDMLYAPSRVKPLLALKVEGASGPPVRVWSTDDGPDVPTPVTDGKYLYVVNDKGIAWCFDAKTGAEVWGQQRLKVGTYSASPVLADGKLFATSEDGVTTVLAAGPRFEVLGENDLGEYTLASPAIADGQIFIRTAQHLYCIGREGEKPAAAPGTGR